MSPTTRFKDKNILIITPFFFDYHKRIKSELIKLGANVDLINERVSNSFLSKVSSRLNLKIYNPVVENYFYKTINSLNRNYDAVLWIKCESPTEKVIKFVKNKYKDAKQILFLWDSIKNINGIEKKLHLFDNIYSFDPEDVSKNRNMKYAYWGYSSEFTNNQSNDNFEYDLAFIGTIHSIRPKVLEQIKRECDKYNLNLYLYQFMPSRILFLAKKLLSSQFKNIKDIKFKPLSTKEMIDIYEKSRAVLEIEESNQAGATTRLGEMIGMKKKLVTTFNCKGKDYYRPSNQYVLDVNNIKLDEKFFKSKYEELPEEIYKKYSFENFLNLIFESINK